MASTAPLLGKTALVTGVSRRKGIGFATAARLAELGASVFIQHYAPHDASQPWGPDDLGLVRDGVRAVLHPGAAFGDASVDLAAAEAAGELIESAGALTGRLDIVVCNHAVSGGDGSIFDVGSRELDLHWNVNARATILLTSLFAKRFTGLDPATPVQPGQRVAPSGPVDEYQTGRVFWLASGQLLGPMPGEVAYAASKAALAGLTATVASELLPHGVILNTINPGPVNTGYLDPGTADRPAEEIEEALAGMPFGRFGEPTDPARLIGWLATDEGRWIIGRVITSDGGFSL